jgi:tRNA pseudouridine38-40 synthase
MARTLKIVLAYDGSRLVGWQRQPEGASIQGALEEALAAIEGRPVTVTGAGRTDAGVHALGQVASCRIAHPLGVEAVRRALNARLPDDVRVLTVDEVSADFHARYSATSKTYRYFVLTDPVCRPFLRPYVWHLPRRLDLDAMRLAAECLRGEHDFAAFRGTGSEVKTTIRTLTDIRIARSGTAAFFGQAFETGPAASDDTIVCFEFDGNGFLRHMVRNLVGSLVEIGQQRQPVEWVGALLAGGDRRQAGMTAPASGLFLVEVRY